MAVTHGVLPTGGVPPLNSVSRLKVIVPAEAGAASSPTRAQEKANPAMSRFVICIDSSQSVVPRASPQSFRSAGQGQEPSACLAGHVPLPDPDHSWPGRRPS